MTVPATVDVARRLAAGDTAVRDADDAARHAQNVYRFVDPHQAQAIAREAEQLAQGNLLSDYAALCRGLTSERIIAAGQARRPGQRVATNAPGLPGVVDALTPLAIRLAVDELTALGMWARADDRLSPWAYSHSKPAGSAATTRPPRTASPTTATGPSTGSSTAWHRANNPGILDLAAHPDLQLPGLAANLRRAFDERLDAAWIRNHIAPGSTTPETVLLVKDKAQFRDRKARFNPVKISSPNLMASIGVPAFSFGALMPYYMDRYAPEDRP